MVRQLRIEFPNAFHHVYSRGINRNVIFCDDHDFKVFTGLLSYIQQKFSLRIFAYCLMNNHYHLYLSTPLANLSQAMKHLNQLYAMYFIKKYPERDGYVFRGRFKSKLVQHDLYSCQLLSYIHLNPVKADLVQDPASCPWSSYASYVKAAHKKSFIDYDWVASQFGSNDSWLEHFKNFHEQSGSSFDPDKDSRLGGAILGDEEFCEGHIAQSLNEATDLENISCYADLKISSIDKNALWKTLVDMGLPEKLHAEVLVFCLTEFVKLTSKQVSQILKRPAMTIRKIKQRAKEKSKNNQEFRDIILALSQSRLDLEIYMFKNCRKVFPVISAVLTQIVSKVDNIFS